MSSATGADLPPEILSYILKSFTLADSYYDLDPSRKLKHGLAGPALVCKHWSEAIRPILLRVFELCSAEDVQFLKNIVSSSEFTASCLTGAIKRIIICQEATGAKSWLHHVHGLSTQLRETEFECIVGNCAGDVASVSMANRWAPFESVPGVTPSYVRLSRLALDSVVFTSKTELAQLVDNFHTLLECNCERLTFLDPSLVVQSRRIWRRPLPDRYSLECAIQECKDMVVPNQVTLAADIVAPARHMGIDNCA
ncbi:uncharacterized protein PHACADRAFT_201085 [Phanerochaete carnosa HHB-10118-sp]|uniref:F-box domain-containing protein n=1 Tax=Phanerochaete carnosa (strain HHB-10118-sp) TaxID=650164 RepID=K5VTX5_PHACS|nr:uncharacterized protein PHACADRAFT_201085 [Phanerochaete carnosa HHB-10118-sp]EKM50245.1 hypothetical protein PHACADRAFT_201085 [Phanerochaete carnosa HHB-10118-sp]